MKFFVFAFWLLVGGTLFAETKTWDGKYDTTQIEVTCVYFVPNDRTPLPDWRDRTDYFCRRIEQFHAREFDGHSMMKATVHSEPLISKLSTEQLRIGDADAIYFRTLREVDDRLNFAKGKAEERTAFPILLVLSEINWRPLDDFFRLHPDAEQLIFEGNFSNQQHFPGATSGGARAAYLADRGVGWGLVSADGWRVPYRGSDCVVYHEGCGHTVGLPHPEPGNGSVMSLGQYQGWISESWLDKEQKVRLGWQAEEGSEAPADLQQDLFSTFRAVPDPLTPVPGQPVTLKLDWPKSAKVKAVRVRFQTAIDGPWIDVPQTVKEEQLSVTTIGSFERETPVSYRVDAELSTGETAEIWGYFQVRQDPSKPQIPVTLSADLLPESQVSDGAKLVKNVPTDELDLLALADPKTCWTNGEWITESGTLVSPKQYGARLQLPYTPPAEYRLTLIVEPLDEPNGLILGQRLAEQRFTTLFNYTPDAIGLSAIEDIDGKNVGNETTFRGNLFQKDRLSQVIVIVQNAGIQMSVDGRTIVYWKGSVRDLSLSDYWKTPEETSLFIGTYDCRYRFHRITLEDLTTASKR